MSNIPKDQAQRDLFANEVNANFSVIAPAGVGKTQSIVTRITQLARQPHAENTLDKLVVVTYANKSALEMQDRARAAILNFNPPLSPVALEAFNRAFFGTIHSFCVLLLQKHGHHIGLPGVLQVLQEDSQLWAQFLRESEELGDYLKSDPVKRLLRHVPLEDLLSLARRIKIHDQKNEKLIPFPEKLETDELFACKSNRVDTQEKIEIFQSMLRRWLELQKNSNEDFLPLPRPGTTAKELISRIKTSLGPVFSCLAQWIYVAGVDIARLYRDFRTDQGFLTFDDQIELAAELLEVPEVAKKIRTEGYRVILDEAQDTDARQFYVLLSVAAGPEEGIELEQLKPRPGHFCMVGDLQQSIHSVRADLPTYRNIHEWLTTKWSGQDIVLHQTFRCDQEIVANVNQFFGRILKDENGQVPYVPLEAREGAGPGQFAILPIQNDFEKSESPGVLRLRRYEAEQVAKWIMKTKLEGLRARSWSEVAILCPRKNWFAALEEALRKEKIPVQVQSFKEMEGDSAACAWLTALVWALSHPWDGYEVVGVLREIYGISDAALHTQMGKSRFVLEPEALDSIGAGSVKNALKELIELKESIAALPLSDAVREIVSSTKLRQRLGRIHDEGVETQDEPGLDELIMRSVTAEFKGATLSDWAEQLREEFYRPRDTTVKEEDAIQILTCYKAKGLEWDAVILPFFFAEQWTPNAKYPQVVPIPGQRHPAICLDSLDPQKEEVAELVSRHRRQEIERLLYVACTRARRTLVIADDEALFTEYNSKGEVKAPRFPTFGKLFFAQDEVNRPLWDKLSRNISAGQAIVQTEVTGNRDKEKKTKVKSLDVKKAQQALSEFTRRTLPHQLAKPKLVYEPEIEGDGVESSTALPADRDAALQYGIWWHELMHALNWNVRESWNGTFNRMLEQAPDVERSQKEWKLFLEQDWILQLTKFSYRAEVPFLWRINESEVMEGITDLAVWREDDKKWLIVDWKTDQIEEGQITQLRDKYAGQINAYTKAWSGIFKNPVEGFIYSTSTGKTAEVSKTN